MGGAFKRLPPAGGGKSRGPAGRGLNRMLGVLNRMKKRCSVMETGLL